MSGFVLHPEALADLDEIWEFIARDSVAIAALHGRRNPRVLAAVLRDRK